MEQLFMFLFYSFPVLGFISLFFNKPTFWKVFSKFFFLIGMFFIGSLIMFIFVDSVPPFWAYLASFSIYGLGLYISFKW